MIIPLHHFITKLAVVGVGLICYATPLSCQTIEDDSLSQEWWEGKLDPISRFAQRLPLRRLSEIAESNGATTVLRLVTGGHMGHIFFHDLIVKYDGTRIQFARLECYYVDSFAIVNEEADGNESGSSYGKFISPRFTPDPLGQLTVEELLSDFNKFFEINKEKQEPRLKNDTIIIAERLSHGTYERIDRNTTGGYVYKGNLDTIHIRFSKLIDALTSVLRQGRE